MESNGECGVCGTGLANHGYAYTVCRHLLCMSCLLKWHKANPHATCPMCRTPFYEEENEIADNEIPDNEIPDNEIPDNEISQMLEFNLDEEIMHDHMMEIVTAHARAVHLRVIQKEESNHYYERIDAGIANPNSHYILEVFDTARAFRFRFGRIENIISHHLFPDSKWYVFRERISRVDEEHAQIVTEWADEIQHIALDNVKLLIQYCGIQM